jgi:hypothetical protein
MPSVIKLNVVVVCRYTEFQFAESRNAECSFTLCCFAKCHGTLHGIVQGTLTEGEGLVQLTSSLR